MFTSLWMALCVWAAPAPLLPPGWGQTLQKAVVTQGPLTFSHPAALRWHAYKHADEVCPEEDDDAVRCYSARLMRVQIDLAYWFVGRRTPGFRVTRLARQRPRRGPGSSAFVVDVCYDDIEHLRLVLREDGGGARLSVVTLYRFL